MQSKRKRSLLVPFCVLAIAGAAVLIGKTTVCVSPGISAMRSTTAQRSPAGKRPSRQMNRFWTIIIPS